MFLGRDGFVWWIGIVEDVEDPLLLGRAKVRIFGYHPKYVNQSTTTGDVNNLVPTADLPWATVVMPPNLPNFYGRLRLGEWVLGFFLDGVEAQEPAILGYIPGLNTGGGENFGKYSITTKSFDEQHKAKPNDPSQYTFTTPGGQYLRFSDKAEVRESLFYNQGNFYVQLYDASGTKTFTIMHPSQAYYQIDNTGRTVLTTGGTIGAGASQKLDSSGKDIVVAGPGGQYSLTNELNRIITTLYPALYVDNTGITVLTTGETIGEGASQKPALYINNTGRTVLTTGGTIGEGASQKLDSSGEDIIVAGPGGQYSLTNELNRIITALYIDNIGRTVLTTGGTIGEGASQKLDSSGEDIIVAGPGGQYSLTNELNRIITTLYSPPLSPLSSEIGAPLSSEIARRGGGCFAGETLVTMWDGTKKRIDEIQVGELVQTGIYSQPGKVVFVEKLMDTMLWKELYSPSVMHEPFATPNHMLFVNKEWVAIDIDLYDWMPKLKPVKNPITRPTKGDPVYNLWLEGGDGTYFVNGYLTHSILYDGGFMRNAREQGCLTHEQVMALMYEFTIQGNKMTYGSYLINKLVGMVKFKPWTKVIAYIMKREKEYLPRKGIIALMKISATVMRLINRRK